MCKKRSRRRAVALPQPHPVQPNRRWARGLSTGRHHQLIPVESCLIIDPLLDDLWSALDMNWPQLRQLTLRCGSATGDLMAVFELDHYEDFDIEVDFPVSCVVVWSTASRSC